MITPILSLLIGVCAHVDTPTPLVTFIFGFVGGVVCARLLIVRPTKSLTEEK